MLLRDIKSTSQVKRDTLRTIAFRCGGKPFIITSDEVEASKQLIADLEQLPVPYVMVDRTIDELDCDKVTFNNELGGYLATKYLLDHGHRRIACMVNTASNTGCARLNGYVRALGEKGLEKLGVSMFSRVPGTLCWLLFSHV